MGFTFPQFVSFQHHVLDRILRHVMDFFIGSEAGVDEQIDYLNPGWRADFKFLNELCRSYEFYKVSFFCVLY